MLNYKNKNMSFMVDGNSKIMFDRAKSQFWEFDLIEGKLRIYALIFAYDELCKVFDLVRIKSGNSTKVKMNAKDIWKLPSKEFEALTDKVCEIPL